MSAGLGRCPKHGTVLVRATAPGQPDKWCYPCWSKTGQYLPAPDAEGACIAMARLLAFVWCEAEARSDGRQAMFSMHGAVAHDNRAFALGRAISLGLLRLEWSR